MLEKTLALLTGYKAGTYIPDTTPCYDEEEIKQLSILLSKLIYGPSELRKRLQSLGVTITRADFYSEIPTISELEASFARADQLKLDHIFRDNEFLTSFLRDLTPFAADFAPPIKPTREDQYAWQSGGIGYSDAMAYYAMIRRYKPKTIVEMGCGISTLIASMACERNGFGRIIAIEPFPSPFLRNIPRVELHELRAQDTPLSLIQENLKDGDFLFIDTTHTVKHDSDCLHIYLRLLPFIRSDVFVHAHDIYLPRGLPVHMLRDQQIYWNEQYLLYAYLVGNPKAKVLYGSAYHNIANPDLLSVFMHGRYAQGGGSLWFSQSGSVVGQRAP